MTWIDVQLTWTEEIEYTAKYKVEREAIEEWLAETGRPGTEITGEIIDRFLGVTDDEESWREGLSTDNSEFSGMEISRVQICHEFEHDGKEPLVKGWPLRCKHCDQDQPDLIHT